MKPKEFWAMQPQEFWWRLAQMKSQRMYGNMTESTVKEIYEEAYGPAE